MPDWSKEKIELTPEEAASYAQIPKAAFAADKDSWEPVAEAMEKLMNSLQARRAIPEIRAKVFCDFAEKGSMSNFETFEANGTKGKAIFRHPHFVEYLHYFINGPDLPSPVIQGFLKIVNEDRGTSGMLLKELQKFVRKSVRDYGLNKREAATNFWRLCHEVDYFSIDTIRRAAMTAK